MYKYKASRTYLQQRRTKRNLFVFSAFVSGMNNTLF